MVFFAACVHPPPSVAPAVPQGYWLDAAVFRKMVPLMGGIPFTFEHAGIMEAAEHLLARGDRFSSNNLRTTLANLATTNPAKVVIGTVVTCYYSASGAWWVTIHMDDAFDAIIWLIARNHCRGVSLTHIQDPVSSQLIPLEVSLCKSPARPHCYIYRAFRRPFEAAEYMRALQRGTIHDPAMENPAETPASVQPPTKMEQALATLAPEHRKLIEDRLVAASNKMQRAIEDMEKTKRLSTITESNLKAQVGVLKAHIDPEILSNCHIDNEEYLNDLYSDNANDVRRTLDRVLIAANTTLMQYKNRQHTQAPVPIAASASAAAATTVDSVSADLPASKRPRTEEPSSSDDRDSALYRIMSDTFDIM